MNLHIYLQVIRRRKLLVIGSVILVAVAAGSIPLAGRAVYRSSARVLLHPGDPSEQLNGEKNQPRPIFDPDRYVAGQIDVVKSEAVARAAAGDLNRLAIPAPDGSARWTYRHVLRHSSVEQDGTSDVLVISATDPEPAQSAELANAVSRAYLENRRVRAVSGLQQASEELESKLGQLQTQIADLDAKIAVATKRDLPPTELVAARQAATAQYQALYGRQQELLVEMSLKRGEAELVSAARRPTSPANRSVVRNTILGAVVGLLLGLGLVFVVDQLDDRLRSREDAEQRNGVPVLAELPFEEEDARDSAWLAMLDQRPRVLAEAVRSLRSSLLFMNTPERLSRVMITSPAPSEGKSVIAANLAASFAQAGFRTVLVSADLRAPSAEALFDIDASRAGLADLVTCLSGARWTPLVIDEARGVTVNGTAMRPAADRMPTANEGDRTSYTANEQGAGGEELNAEPKSEKGIWRPNTAAEVGRQDQKPVVRPELAAEHALITHRDTIRTALRSVLVQTPVPDLQLLPAGETRANPAELLGSRSMADVLDEVSASADIVVIDTPPVLAVTDATVLAPLSNAVLLVNALHETRGGAAERAREILAGVDANVVGVVVNKVRRSIAYHGYYGSDADATRAGRKQKERRGRHRGRRGSSARRRSGSDRFPDRSRAEA